MAHQLKIIFYSLVLSLICVYFFELFQQTQFSPELQFHCYTGLWMPGREYALCNSIWDWFSTGVQLEIEWIGLSLGVGLLLPFVLMASILSFLYGRTKKKSEIAQ